MSQLKSNEHAAVTKQSVPLPRVGSDLAMSILLKAAGGNEENKASARLIHQARVRRDVVVELIEEMKRRGHRAYKHVDMHMVQDRARMLPEDDIPPEIIRMLPFDGAHDQLQPNKNATPVVGSKSENDIAEELETRRFNAVVCERSSYDEYDKVAQDRACVERTVKKLKKSVEPVSDEDSATNLDDETSEDESSNNTAWLLRCRQERRGQSSEHGDNVKNIEEEQDVENDDTCAQIERIGVKTGNHLIDQFEPAYFGTAHAFMFSYNCGFPDMQTFSKKGRGRRTEEAPRIEIWEWVRSMSRRAAASVSGDYSFGFLTWNYLFRSSINLTQSLFAYEQKIIKPRALNSLRRIWRRALYLSPKLCGGRIKTLMVGVRTLVET